MDILYYLTYDLPVEYKNIKIYPVTVKDYMLFNVYSQCLTIDKNIIPDPKIISMTNLEYMVYSTNENVEEHPYLFWFDRLLSMCLKDDKSFEKIEESIGRYNYDEKEKPYFTIGKDRYISKDFDEIKDIICKQNIIELPDENVSKEVRDAIDKAREYKNKISGSKAGTFEDYIISLSIVTGWTLEYIHSMTIRKFVKSIKRIDNLIHYKIYLASSMSGMVEFKDKSFIKHWLTDIDGDNKNDDVLMDLGDVQNKVSLESAKG